MRILILPEPPPPIPHPLQIIIINRSNPLLPSNHPTLAYSFSSVFFVTTILKEADLSWEGKDGGNVNTFISSSTKLALWHPENSHYWQLLKPVI